MDVITIWFVAWILALVFAFWKLRWVEAQSQGNDEIAKIAEQRNHHPDINIGWCKVGISITSHDLGGVTTKCVNLATSIDLL